REKTFMYYIKTGAVGKVPRKRPGMRKGKPEKVVDAGVTQDFNYIYFLDKDGDVARARRAVGGQKRKKAGKAMKKAKPAKKAAKKAAKPAKKAAKKAKKGKKGKRKEIGPVRARSPALGARSPTGRSLRQALPGKGISCLRPLGRPGLNPRGGPKAHDRLREMDWLSCGGGAVPFRSGRARGRRQVGRRGRGDGRSEQA